MNGLSFTNGLSKWFKWWLNKLENRLTSEEWLAVE